MSVLSNEAGYSATDLDSRHILYGQRFGGSTDFYPLNSNFTGDGELSALSASISRIPSCRIIKHRLPPKALERGFPCPEAMSIFGDEVSVL